MHPQAGGGGVANNSNGSSGVPYNSSVAAGCKKSLFSIHIKLFTSFVLTSITDLRPGGNGAGWRGGGRGGWCGRQGRGS